MEEVEQTKLRLVQMRLSELAGDMPPGNADIVSACEDGAKAIESLLAEQQQAELIKALQDHTKAMWAHTHAMKDLARAIHLMPSSMKVRF